MSQQKIAKFISEIFGIRVLPLIFYFIVLLRSGITPNQLIFIYFYGNKLLFDLNLITILILVVVGVITRFWKISFHASLITGTVILTNFLFNWSLPFLYLLIPVVLWARFVLKHHNLNQLLAGSLV